MKYEATIIRVEIVLGDGTRRILVDNGEQPSGVIVQRAAFQSSPKVIDDLVTFGRKTIAFKPSKDR